MAIVIISVIAASAFVVAGNVTKGTQMTKLEVDVSEINTSIRLYLASGGSFTGVSTPQQVIDKLKTSRTAEAAARYAGLSSTMADARLKAVMQTANEAAEPTPRAIWNSSDQRFEISSSGGIGVKHFTLEDSLAAVDYGTETRDSSMVDVNPGDGWIWTFSDSQASTGTSPTNVPLPPSTGGPSATGTSSSGGGGTGSGGGSSGSGSSGGSSSSSGSGGSGGDDDDDADDDDDEGDDDDDEDYNPPPQRLQMPQIYPTTDKHLESNFPLSITITDFNSPSVSELEYKIDSGSWTEYSGGFEITANQRVHARAVSQDTDNYINSWTRSRTYRPLASNFTGDLSPSWTNVAGGQNLEYDITAGGSNQTSLTHGDTTIFIGGEEQEAGTANSLSFEAASFGSTLGESFAMGELSFYNGSTFNQSDAESVTLTIELNLSEPISMQQTINVPLSLISTPNSDDSYDSADSVNLGQQSFNLSQSIEGVNYRLSIEFGPAQDGGFGTGSSISAFEGAQVKAGIYGKFLSR